MKYNTYIIKSKYHGTIIKTYDKPKTPWQLIRLATNYMVNHGLSTKHFFTIEYTNL